MAKDIQVIEQKPWGTCERIHRSSAFEVVRLEIKKGGQSTYGNFHYHKLKYNKFYVESGKIKIEKKRYEGNIESFLLGPNERYRAFNIFPTIDHRFIALEDSVVYEIYYVVCDSKDIHRLFPEDDE